MSTLEKGQAVVATAVCAATNRDIQRVTLPVDEEIVWPPRASHVCVYERGLEFIKAAKRTQKRMPPKVVPDKRHRNEIC